MVICYVFQDLILSEASMSSTKWMNKEQLDALLLEELKEDQVRGHSKNCLICHHNINTVGIGNLDVSGFPMVDLVRFSNGVRILNGKFA